nr:Sortase (surface protein transpeptidase) [Streptococcus thermophilus]
MSTATPNPKNQPDPEETSSEKFPENASEKETEATAGSEKNSNKKLPLILAALLGVVALICAIAFIPWGGSDNAEEASETSQSQSQEPTSTAPEVIEDGYVDDSGQQEEELTPVPESHEDIGEMALQMSIGTAPVDLVGLTDEGALIPPEDVSRLGWYASSAIPGDPDAKGSTVITGHVNHQTQGQGFAYNFTQLAAGDEVSVLIDGTTHTYRVTKPPFRASKEGALPEEVNDSTGENKLVLITCGGEFVGGTLGYADNVFVVAEPV